MLQAVFVVFSSEVSNTRSAVVGHSATQLFLGYIFTGNGFNYCRAGNEHFGSVLYHVDEVSQCRAVYSAASGRTHNCRNLRNYAGSNGVLEEDFTIASQSVDSFLDTSTAGIVQANQRSTHFQCQALYFNDFSSMHFAEGATFNGEVLCEYINQTAIDGAVTGGYAFTRQFFLFLTEVVATMTYKTVEFYEGTFVEESSDSFTSSHFAGFMLFSNTFFATSSQNYFGFFEHFLNFFLSRQILHLHHYWENKFIHRC